ncbi:uncharacterized protein LOC132932235 [Rhopalosiphum padi]|uniref:uncharacterized protein LOC132932235 n=1 Tax=Rhopalosiphum padi TaxID=40932 RepID=UPI00298DC5B8|nr:uncharacterized protein LOC132932235 [Rhopalosiphum padi]
MPVADSEYDGVYVIANNHYLRDYHRSAEQQQQTAVVIAGNYEPTAATGPEVQQALHPMAPPALQQRHRQQQPDGDGADFVAVSSRKYRYLCEG